MVTEPLWGHFLRSLGNILDLCTLGLLLSVGISLWEAATLIAGGIWMLLPLGSPVPLCLCPVLGDRDVLSDPEQPWCSWGSRAAKKSGYGQQHSCQTPKRKHRAMWFSTLIPCPPPCQAGPFLPSTHRKFWLCGRDLPAGVLLIKAFSLQRVFLFKREDGTEFQLQTPTVLMLHISIGLQVMSCEYYMGFALHSFSPSHCISPWNGFLDVSSIEFT